LSTTISKIRGTHVNSIIFSPTATAATTTVGLTMRTNGVKGQAVIGVRVSRDGADFRDFRFNHYVATTTAIQTFAIPVIYDDNYDTTGAIDYDWSIRSFTNEVFCEITQVKVQTVELLG